MSHEDQKLMRMIDARILNSSKEELAKLQQMDIKTQLDGIWFYDTCNTLDQIEQKQSIRNNKTFSKQTR